MILMRVTNTEQVQCLNRQYQIVYVAQWTLDTQTMHDPLVFPHEKTCSQKMNGPESKPFRCALEI